MERKKRQMSLHRGWFAKGCRPCLCVLLTRCTSILSACLGKLISIAAEALFENESILHRVEDFLDTCRSKRNRLADVAADRQTGLLAKRFIGEQLNRGIAYAKADEFVCLHGFTRERAFVED